MRTFLEDAAPILYGLLVVAIITLLMANMIPFALNGANPFKRVSHLNAGDTVYVRYAGETNAGIIEENSVNHCVVRIMICDANGFKMRQYWTYSELRKRWEDK